MQVKFAARGVARSTFDASKAALIAYLASLISVPATSLQLDVFAPVAEELLLALQSQVASPW
jgi:hypothetical protein